MEHRPHRRRPRLSSIEFTCTDSRFIPFAQSRSEIMPCWNNWQTALSLGKRFAFLAAAALPAFGDTTISPTNRYAYGANIGWLDFRPSVSNGASIGEFYCSGFLYSANCGWINL